MKKILENHAVSPQNYVDLVTGNCYIMRHDQDDIDQITELLILNEKEHLKLYPLTDIKSVENSEKNIVLVECYSFEKEGYELYWGEVE